MMHHWHESWSVGEWLVMGFGMLLFWALLVAGIVWLVRSTTADRRNRTGHDRSADERSVSARPNAREILDARYARGEIGDEEYRTRRDTMAAR